MLKEEGQDPGEGSKNNREAAKGPSQRDWIVQEKEGETPNRGFTVCKVGKRTKPRAKDGDHAK